MSSIFAEGYEGLLWDLLEEITNKNSSAWKRTQAVLMLLFVSVMFSLAIAVLIALFYFILCQNRN